MKYIYIVLFILCSCSTDEQCLMSDNLVADKVITKAITQSTSPTFDWEDTPFIMLDGYGSQILPWYNATDTTIPTELLEDYKKEDGWEMVYNLCTPSDLTTYGKYYLIFYNKLRGILRVFYYNIYNTTSANTTFWQLSFTRPTSMLNSIGHFTMPININDVQSTYTTNLSSIETKAISRGWNCFDVELCYDPNSTSIAQKMGIKSYDVTQGKLTLTGDLKMDSEGTIVTTSSVPRFPILSGMITAGVTGFGGSISKIVSSKLDSAKISPLISMPVTEIISSGVTGLVKSGINLIFGSFLGKKATTTQTLKVRTTGQIQTNGEFSFNSSSNINPIVNLVCPGSKVESSDSFLPSYNEPLGVWNLKEAPIVTLSSGAVWVKREEFDYQYTRLVDVKPIREIVVNPAVKECFSKYDISYELMYYKSFGGSERWGSEMFFPEYGYTYMNYTTPIVGNLLFNDDGNCFLLNPHTSQEKVRSYPYQAVDYTRRGKVIKFLDNIPIENPNYVVKVMVTFYPKAPYNTTPIVSSRTYIPQYVVDKNLLDPTTW